MSLYKDFKNHLHNTLGITKDNIREMTEKAVEKVVERKLEVIFKEKFDSQYTMQRIIDDSIKQKITSANWYWGASEDSLDDYIKKEVVKSLLKNVKIRVDLDHSNGEEVLKIVNKPTVHSEKGSKKKV